MKHSTNGMIAIEACGIPCFADIVYFADVPGKNTWDSDWDYYGYTEVEFQLYDRKGYWAKWLEDKVLTVEGEYDRISDVLIKKRREDKYEMSIM